MRAVSARYLSIASSRARCQVDARSWAALTIISTEPRGQAPSWFDSLTTNRALSRVVSIGSMPPKPTPITSNNDKSEPPSYYFIQSLARGLAVIQSFDDERAAQTVADVARATGQSRAVSRRLLLTLKDLGFVTNLAGISP